MSFILSNDSLLAFSTDNGGKASNGTQNDVREKVIVALLTAEQNEVDSARSTVDDKELFDDLRRALAQAINLLATSDHEVKGMRFKGVKRRGGMSNNHDLDLHFEEDKRELIVPVELKRGESIYDQPQFLSLYANNRHILGEGVPHYGEYFYDNYFAELQQISKCPSTSRDAYLARLFSPDYSPEPFNHLYRFVKTSQTNRKLMAALQHNSINSYLTYIARLTNNGFNLEALQGRMYAQLPKRFLSWSPHSRTFSWERFSKDSLTLTPSFSTLAKASGQLTTVVIHTQSGQTLQLLLRWKNNPCVKGPAWQIRLTK